MEYSIKPVKVVQPVALEIILTPEESQDIAFALRIGATRLKNENFINGISRGNSLLHLAKYIEDNMPR